MYEILDIRVPKLAVFGIWNLPQSKGQQEECYSRFTSFGNTFHTRSEIDLFV
jgi:hypothetical protein